MDFETLENLESVKPVDVEKCFDRFNYHFDKSFKHKNALSAGLLASLVYDECESITQHAEKLGLKDKIIEVEGNFLGHKYEKYRAVIFYDDVYMFLVFRGTNNFTEAMTDLAANKTLSGVHVGFQAAYDAFVHKGKLHEEVSSCRQSGQKLTIVGHSLGGALAFLAGYDFRKKGEKDIAVYTFGQPRVSGPLFRGKFDKLFKHTPYFRIVNQGDPVTHLPPKMPGALFITKYFLYDHSHKLYRKYEKDGTYASHKYNRFFTVTNPEVETEADAILEEVNYDDYFKADLSLELDKVIVDVHDDPKEQELENRLSESIADGTLMSLPVVGNHYMDEYLSRIVYVIDNK